METGEATTDVDVDRLVPKAILWESREFGAIATALVVARSIPLLASREGARVGVCEVVRTEDVMSGVCEVVRSEDVRSGVCEVVRTEDGRSGVCEVVRSEDVMSGVCEVVRTEDVMSGVCEVVRSEDVRGRLCKDVQKAESGVVGFVCKKLLVLISGTGFTCVEGVGVGCEDGEGGEESACAFCWEVVEDLAPLSFC